MVTGKPFCSVCKGPREDWSQLYTCKKCHRERVRESARRRKVLIGTAKKPQDFCSRCHDVRTGRHPSYCLGCWKIKRKERGAAPCFRCGAERDPSEGRGHAYCYSCWRDYMLQKSFGISAAEFDEMLAEQDHRCAICGDMNNGRQWHVDHCHKTGAIRGILCNLCNCGLGMFRDSTKLLYLAADYLDKPRSHL